MPDFYSSIYNPDVLTCLANLSNDEVFTPPDVANQMLDMLPEELWHDSSATFLDPACKSGVFLREIAKRLIVGLEDEFPDLQERIDHIFHHQLYGIAITELTSLLSRRSVYCSKFPNSKYSISHFEDVSGKMGALQNENSAALLLFSLGIRKVGNEWRKTGPFQENAHKNQAPAVFGAKCR